MPYLAENPAALGPPPDVTYRFYRQCLSRADELGAYRVAAQLRSEAGEIAASNHGADPFGLGQAGQDLPRRASAGMAETDPRLDGEDFRWRGPSGDARKTGIDARHRRVHRDLTRVCIDKTARGSDRAPFFFRRRPCKSKSRTSIRSRENMGRALDFYRDLLGMTMKFQDGTKWAQLDAGGARFALSSPEEAGAAVASNTVIVFEVDDLAAMREAARGDGGADPGHARHGQPRQHPHLARPRRQHHPVLRQSAEVGAFLPSPAGLTRGSRASDAQLA